MALIIRNEPHKDILRGIDKNLFDNSVYTIENDHNYRYVFTENDYKKAIDCGVSNPLFE